MADPTMKPSCRRVLARLRQGPASTHELMQANVGGVRFGARLKELRDLGFVILEERLPLPTRGSRYALVGEPERTLSETKDPAPWEQASPGSVPSQEGVRLAASAQAQPSGSLFDADVYGRTGSYRDAEAA